MATAIQAIPSVFAVSSPSALGTTSPLAQRANSLLIVPSVIVTLGANSPVPVTYNAAGLFESLLRVADTTTGTSGAAVVPAPAASNPDTATTTTMVDQTLARQTLIDSFASATGLDTIGATSVTGNAEIVQGLLSNNAVQPSDSLLSTNLGLSVAALLNSTGTAATTTTASNGTWITTVATTGNPTSADMTQALNSSLLGNVDLTTSSTPKVRSNATGTTANTGAVSNAIHSMAAAATIAPVGTAATTPATTPATASNTPSAAVGANASGTPEVTSALADSFLLDSVAQAQATIEGNPAYASAAAGLYMNAMVFHSQQSAAAGPLGTADSVQPVAALPRVSAVKLVRR